MKRFGLILLIVMVVAIAAAPAMATEIHVFYGDGCPHCEALMKFLESIRGDYPNLTINYYEIYYNKTNKELLSDLSDAYGTEVSGVPTYFIDDKVLSGYSDRLAPGIEEQISYCTEAGCLDPMDKLKGITETNNTNVTETHDTAVNIPFIGEIDGSRMSLPLFTFIIGLLDGFNPCAFFVLFFLLSILIYAKSRQRMLIIGGTFVFFSGLIYFIFMAAWLNFFLLIGALRAVTITAGLVAIAIAAINIKDYFFFKKGISLTISDSAKPKLYKRMRELVKATSFPMMILGTIGLAIAANMYELLCTAGFPMVFTRILTLSELDTAGYYLYLLLYNIFYVIPLAAIVIFVTITLGARKLTEEQGEILKLMSGTMMLALGIVLLAAPEMLNNLFAAAGILFGALLLCWIIVLGTGKKRRKDPKRKDTGQEQGKADQSKASSKDEDQH